MFSQKLKNFMMPSVFLGVLIFSILFGNYLPYQLKSLLYAVSLTIKEVLIFCLPIIIFSLVYNSAYKLGGRALKYILILVPLICCSNFINTMISYCCCCIFSSFDMITVVPALSLNNVNVLNVMFEFSLPKIVSNDVALLSGILLGILGSFIKDNRVEKVSRSFNCIQTYFFKILTPIMPLFILGTALKLQHDGMLNIICKNYLPILLLFILSAYGFVTLQYSLLASCKFERFVQYLKNIIPAIIVGFGAMSSAAALPLSIRGTAQNSKNEENASIVVPATVNIHLVGDCFFIPMMAISILISFGHGLPEFSKYLVFSLYFVLAKFAVAAVPGGGVLVMLPILQKHLGFSADMLGLITAIYILFDSVITACNVAGNGAMGILFDKIMTKIGGIKN